MNTLALLLILSQIDGYQLLARARASKNGKSYYAYLQEVKKDILDKSWVAAEKGETSLFYCFGPDDRWGQRIWEDVRRDIDKMFYRIDGLLLRSKSIDNVSCFTVDWGQ